MKIYTYYEQIHQDKRDGSLKILDLWSKNWKSKGFEPIVLTSKDAELKGDYYKEFKECLYDLIDNVYDYDRLYWVDAGLSHGGLFPEKFRMGVAMATGAIMILYLFGWIGQIFGFEVAMLHDSGMFGIGISAVIIVVASMNLLLDFDMFERGEKQGAPIYMEWFAAMGLIVTLVWLYIEFLRLLSKLRD